MTDRSRRFSDWGDDGAPTPQNPLQCTLCRNIASRRRMTCRAYPDGIPAIILRGEHDHRTPFVGDHGVRFEPVDEDAAAIVAALFEGGDA